MFLLSFEMLTDTIHDTSVELHILTWMINAPDSVIMLLHVL